MSTQQAPELDIPVAVTGEFTGNVTPLLHEVRHALAALLESDEQTVIDLRAMPLAPGEEARIEAALDQGEVRVELNALGRSDIVETQYPGVWLIAQQYRRQGCRQVYRNCLDTRHPAGPTGRY